MERKINRECVVCGRKYSYCRSCRDDANKPEWMASFCSSTCRDVYEAAAGFYAKQKTADEAKAILDKCDLSNKANFTPATQRLIKEIYESATPVSVEKTEVKVETTPKAESKINVQSMQNKNFKKNKHR